MQPWFIATEKLSPNNADKWQSYIQWSGLTQLDELVSLDSMLCPTLLPEIKDEYWSHIVEEDFMLNFFLDLDFLLDELNSSHLSEYNLLCVERNPQSDLLPQVDHVAFEFLGYDLVDAIGSASALSNCGGFPLVFSNEELNAKGLLSNYTRALEVQAMLRHHYPDESHANCHLWSISRATVL